MPAREAPVPVQGQYSSDPLDAALRPPLDETEEEKALRLALEAEAKRISQEIDESIKQEKQAKKRSRIVRLLLLGQSESGKSTTLRQFQRIYTPNAFREERVLWRSVIQLNIVRSIRIILDAIQDVRRHELLAVSSDTEYDDYADQPVGLPPHLHAICMRLVPLRHVESLLIAKLVPPNEDEATHLGVSGSSYNTPSYRQHEIFVRPTTTWKGAINKHGSKSNGSGSPGMDSPEESQVVINQCRHDMIALWNDRTVRDILKRRKIRLEESPGFYLDELERVTSLRYLPSDNDVLKARLKTVGVSEYKFQMEAGSESGTEWRIIDVGGSRSQVLTWIPFFDDVDAIIFLAPISGFDQTLVEDKSVNRLEDSVLLWKAVCSNKLLAKVDLVLFLNKCDILASKLRSGIRLSKYVRSFGERPNDSETAEKYFRSKFNAIHREHSPIPRKFYGFCTSVTDTTTTMGILASVRDMVIREHLRQSRLL
ncbi:guanine nucleotide binding protein, alpha subunit [Cristinia sonorae]|uniref:Guanine nucleotide binding protein, alpha subunit n=1 Tax=Cristinia sonorae TaxID=1940300 RepID=A0A8K0USX6_9AGAR|nr:guanine nucleotide binding protein, alpha subunit [Cristinia sonorae]